MKFSVVVFIGASNGNVMGNCILENKVFLGHPSSPKHHPLMHPTPPSTCLTGQKDLKRPVILVFKTFRAKDQIMQEIDIGKPYKQRPMVLQTSNQK